VIIVSDEPLDADSVVPWPLKAVTEHLLARPAPPGFLLSYAEALEEAAAHAEGLSSSSHPIARGIRDLASAVRSAVPTRDDALSELETVHDPA
jgi:hypothetical protein